MPDQLLVNVKRCAAQHNGSECGSAVFYDWGIQIMENVSIDNMLGVAEKYKDSAYVNNVKICARCTTPYAVVEGKMIDIGAELSAEDVKNILARGQAQLPHPKIKDP